MSNGHLTARLALRAAGTVPGSPIHPRWLLAVLLAAVVILVLERKTHAPIALAAVPFDQAWKAWREELKARDLKLNTIRQYRTRLHIWAGWLERPPRGRHRKQWWQATQEDLHAFLRRACLPGNRNAGLPLCQTTRAVYSSTIPPLYRFAYSRGLIDQDPMAGWRPLRKAEPTGTPLDLGEVDRLLAYTRRHPDRRLEVLVGLCYYDALRSGEPTHLDVADVDLHAVEPRIRVLGKGRVAKEWFSLHRELVPILRVYLPWLAERYGCNDWRELPAGTPLIQHAQRLGQPISAWWAGQLLVRAMREAQVPGRPHDLRRTAANQVGEKFEDNPGPLRAVLRHRGYTALDAYRQPSVRKIAEYMDAIERPDTPAPARHAGRAGHRVSRRPVRHVRRAPAARPPRHRVQRGWKRGGAGR